MRKKMLDPYRNISIRELIGLDVTVVAHTDPTLEGLRGRIIDETRNMFLVRSEEKDRKVAKIGASFELMVNGPKGISVITLKGDELATRPEDRTKKLERRKQLLRPIRKGSGFNEKS